MLLIDRSICHEKTSSRGCSFGFFFFSLLSLCLLFSSLISVSIWSRTRDVERAITHAVETAVRYAITSSSSLSPSEYNLSTDYATHSTQLLLPPPRVCTDVTTSQPRSFYLLMLAMRVDVTAYAEVYFTYKTLFISSSVHKRSVRYAYFYFR